MKSYLPSLALLVGCNAPTVRPLPSASITPHFGTGPVTEACGDDVSFGDSATPYVRYRYAYDALGRLAHATGTYAVGPDASIDYTYDHLDHVTHVVNVPGGSTGRYEVIAEYDTLGDLLDYSYDDTEPRYHDWRRYVYESFTDAGLPAREVISSLVATDLGYQLAYDASGRIMQVVRDDGIVTTYTYDDTESRTVTIDTDHGAMHGEIIYDDQSRELSEAWDGSDPSVIASDQRFDYDGDRLLKITYRSGTTDAPHALQVVEVDTLVYACAVATRTTHLPVLPRVSR